ncbi:MAG: hypothetical protein HYZ22_10100 [Chloroflexi bacterium]|nr:hypothetical protein [Chloroflexota bacterium]
MKKEIPRLTTAIITIFVAMLACDVSGNATEAPAQPPTELVAILDTPANSSQTEIPIQHQVLPAALPQSRSGQAGDQDSSVTADQKKSNGGDRFTLEQFERPFSTTVMDVYFPNLDIVNTYVFQDDTWVYGTVKVVDRSAATVEPYRFAMQLDVQVDGRGDWLILTLNPTSTDWTTDGVQIYFDANGDVGNQTPMGSDKNALDGDGFEQMLFDQGKGDDPDAAWVRISPDDSNTVEIAVKRSVIGNPIAYLANMWTGHGTLDPAMFDYSDHYTHEQAGAADPGFPLFYPIKSIYELDNSCRIAVGFQPTGSEPGLCLVSVAPATGPEAVPGSGAGPSCVEYGGGCGGGGGCCNDVPCTGGLCRYP